MKKEYAEYLINKTKDDYNKIAGDFDRTRSYLWDDLRQFAGLVKEGSVILDFGCGNGRLSELFTDIKDTRYIGIDQSCSLIERAKEKYAGGEFICSDSPGLPFPDAYFDAIFSVAVLHHIPSERKRNKLLAEWHRVLKPGGILVVTVWNLWQKRYAGLIVKHTLKKISGQSDLDYFDIMVPWKDAKRNVVVDRYYRAFTFTGLEKVVSNGGFKIQDSDYFGGPAKKFNIYAIARK